MNSAREAFITKEDVYSNLKLKSKISRLENGFDNLKEKLGEISTIYREINRL